MSRRFHPTEAVIKRGVRRIQAMESLSRRRLSLYVARQDPVAVVCNLQIMVQLRRIPIQISDKCKELVWKSSVRVRNAHQAPWLDRRPHSTC